MKSDIKKEINKQLIASKGAPWKPTKEPKEPAEKKLIRGIKGNKVYIIFNRNKKLCFILNSRNKYFQNILNGTRTHVVAVKGQSPNQLDDKDLNTNPVLSILHLYN